MRHGEGFSREPTLNQSCAPESSFQRLFLGNLRHDMIFGCLLLIKTKSLKSLLKVWESDLSSQRFTIGRHGLS